jgi:hypothetical protein
MLELPLGREEHPIVQDRARRFEQVLEQKRDQRFQAGRHADREARDPTPQQPAPVHFIDTDGNQRTDGQGNPRWADRPFERGDPSRRSPEKGFLSLRKEVVEALAAAGLSWGAGHTTPHGFGGEAGDAMHFDCREGGC